MSVELETLHELQALDVLLLEKQCQVDAYEGSLAKRRADVAECDARIAKLAAQRKTIVNDRAFAERKVSDAQVQLKDRRQRISRVRTESELRASEREVSSMEREISEYEESLLQLMEQVEQIESQIAAVQAERKQHEDADRLLMEEEAARIEALRAEVAAQREQRDKVALALDVPLRKRYDQVLSKRGGRAVVQVANGSCQGCHMQVPPQTIIEVMRTRAVRVCPQCQRILYIAPQETA